MNANSALCSAFERLAKAADKDLEGTHAPSTNPSIALVHWVNKFADAPCWKPLELAGSGSMTMSVADPEEE